MSVTPGTVALVVLLSLLWGINFPSIKIAVSEVPVWSFRVMCIASGGGALLLIARYALGHRLDIPRGERRRLVLAAMLNVTGWQLFSAFGLMRLDAGRGAIIAYTMPLWASFMAWIFLGEPLTRLRAAGLICGLAGLLVLIGPDLIDLGRAPAGTVLMLAAALCWAAGTVLIKSRNWTIPVTVLTGWQLIFGGVPILAGMLVLEGDTAFRPLSTAGWIATTYSVLVPMIVCHLVWYTLIRNLPTTIAGISTLAIPIVGVYSAALILDEAVGPREAIALMLVATALGIVLALPTFLRILRRDT